jgi:hypothetical protein
MKPIPVHVRFDGQKIIQMRVDSENALKTWKSAGGWFMMQRLKHNPNGECEDGNKCDYTRCKKSHPIKHRHGLNLCRDNDGCSNPECENRHTGGDYRKGLHTSRRAKKTGLDYDEVWY